MANVVKRNERAVAKDPYIERVIAERYRLQLQMARGSNAHVYYATDIKNNSIVAVKLFFRDLESDPQFVARFRQEVRMTRKLAHPNITRIFDYGYDGERYFIVMEHIDGGNLQSLLKQEGALSTARIVQLVAQICDGLEYAHSQGIIHRVLKPQNVLLDGKGQVHLSDFGLARAVGNTGLTVTNPSVGVVAYLAPEQVQRSALTAATDIYALGVMMFEMATGRLPFEHPSAIMVALAHAKDEPPRPSAFNKNVSPALEQIILRCMAKDPARRYASAAELKEALLACLSNRPVLQPNPATPPKQVAVQPQPTAKQPAEQVSRQPSAPVQATPAAVRPEPVAENVRQLAYNPPAPVAAKGRVENPVIGELARSSATSNKGKSGISTKTLMLVGLPLLLIVVAVIVGLLVLKPGSAQSKSAQGTKAGGTLTGATIWRASDGPVLVEKDLLVGSGATLSIEPGVMVRLGTGVNLRIEGGTLQAIGTPGNPVVFTSAQEQPKPGDWGGVLVAKGGTATLAQVEIHNGGSAVTPLDTRRPAVMVADGRLEMVATKVFKSAGVGLVIQNKAAGYVTGSTFSSNADPQVINESKSFNFTANQVVKNSGS
ncbi:MAG TPA: protein kinase [Chloroflexia bacterium]|nr:protein kinase [Chloroflexia bacterium]